MRPHVQTCRARSHGVWLSSCSEHTNAHEHIRNATRRVNIHTHNTPHKQYGQFPQPHATHSPNRCIANIASERSLSTTSPGQYSLATSVRTPSAPPHSTLLCCSPSSSTSHFNFHDAFSPLCQPHKTLYIDATDVECIRNMHARPDTRHASLAMCRRRCYHRARRAVRRVSCEQYSEQLCCVWVRGCLGTK